MSKKTFYIIDSSVLPDVFMKVLEVKYLLEAGSEKTIQDATQKVGISRSAFYKYRNSVFPLYENSRGKTITIALAIEDTQGLLSNILNNIAHAGCNILTINQNIPLNGIANITITIETGKMKHSFEILASTLEACKGVKNFKIIARE